MKTILIIDDEVMIRDLLNRALTKMNYTVLAAENGTTGLEIFNNHYQEIDMVIVDMLMPDMNGTAVVYKMKEIDAGVITVLSSGQGESEIQEAVKDVGATGYLLKPFRVTQLSSIIDEIFMSAEVLSQ